MATADANKLLRAHTGMDVRSYRRTLLGLNRNMAHHPDYGRCTSEAEADDYITDLLATLRPHN